MVCTYSCGSWSNFLIRTHLSRMSPCFVICDGYVHELWSCVVHALLVWKSSWWHCVKFMNFVPACVWLLYVVSTHACGRKIVATFQNFWKLVMLFRFSSIKTAVTWPVLVTLLKRNHGSQWIRKNSDTNPVERKQRAYCYRQGFKTGKHCHNKKNGHSFYWKVSMWAWIFYLVLRTHQC